MPKIKVHEKALAHLSRGLYRSPASALRELVSNAWDASATIVRINTSYPTFFQLSVTDNGQGFTRSDFERLMQGGIGNSPKRPVHDAPINQRPVIGRLGIGMLGIAQICGSFTVTSKPKRGTGFRAIREYLHNVLRTEVFPQVYRKIDMRSDERTQRREADRTGALARAVANALDLSVKVTQRPFQKPIMQLTGTRTRLSLTPRSSGLPAYE